MINILKSVFDFFTGSSYRRLPPPTFEYNSSFTTHTTFDRPLLDTLGYPKAIEVRVQNEDLGVDTWVRQEVSDFFARISELQDRQGTVFEFEKELLNSFLSDLITALNGGSDRVRMAA